MKPLFLPILILFISGCASGSASGTFDKDRPNVYKLSKDTYKTPYGIIKRGYSKKQVKEIMGEPHTLIAEDTWYYRFNKDNHLFVHFIEGKVAIVSKPQSGRL